MSDGIDELSGTHMRTVVAAASQLGRIIAQVRQRQLAEARQRSEANTRALQAQLAAERGAAKTRLAAANSKGWWDQATRHDIATTTRDAQQFRNDPALSQQAAQFQEELAQRYQAEQQAAYAHDDALQAQERADIAQANAQARQQAASVPAPTPVRDAGSAAAAAAVGVGAAAVLNADELMTMADPGSTSQHADIIVQAERLAGLDTADEITEQFPTLDQSTVEELVARKKDVVPAGQDAADIAQVEVAADTIEWDTAERRGLKEAGLQEAGVPAEAIQAEMLTDTQMSFQPGAALPVTQAVDPADDLAQQLSATLANTQSL